MCQRSAQKGPFLPERIAELTLWILLPVGVYLLLKHLELRTVVSHSDEAAFSALCSGSFTESDWCVWWNVTRVRLFPYIQFFWGFNLKDLCVCVKALSLNSMLNAEKCLSTVEQRNSQTALFCCLFCKQFRIVSWTTHVCLFVI